MPPSRTRPTGLRRAARCRAPSRATSTSGSTRRSSPRADTAIDSGHRAASNGPVARAYTTHVSAARRRRIGGLRLLVAAVVAAVLVGGYQEHWSWTGISGKTATLWDWFELLLLPITVATLPLWLA